LEHFVPFLEKAYRIISQKICFLFIVNVFALFFLLKILFIFELYN